MIFAHIGFIAMAEGRSRKSLQLTAWGLIATLMAYKAFQVSQTEHNSIFFFVLIGVSYYTFRISSTLFDVARRTLEKPSSTDFMLYCLFFPIFVGGPVQRYKTFKRNNSNIETNPLVGLFRIGRALVKKILIADIVILFFIAWIEAQLTGAKSFNIGGDGPLSWATTISINPGLGVLLYGFLNLLRAYIDLSAFTDLALGLSRLFGYEVAENFNRPFFARNIVDFWRRWHLTIAGWAKDYLFSPLMLSTRNLAVAVFFTMIAMGLWHELSGRWLFWGACHGLGLIACGWWQRTRPYMFLLKTEKKLHAHVETTVQKFEGIFPIYVRSGASLVLTSGVSSIFFVPAWLLTFGYMSIVIVAVSRPNLTAAFDFCRLSYGG